MIYGYTMLYVWALSELRVFVHQRNCAALKSRYFDGKRHSDVVISVRSWSIFRSDWLTHHKLAELTNNEIILWSKLDGIMFFTLFLPSVMLTNATISSWTLASKTSALLTQIHLTSWFIFQNYVLILCWDWTLVISYTLTSLSSVWMRVTFPDLGSTLKNSLELLSKVMSKVTGSPSGSEPFSV